MFRRWGSATVLVSAWMASAMAQEDRSIVFAYKTDTAPVIDGVIGPGEWDAAGPPIIVAPEEAGTAIAEDPFGGPADLSYQFRFMWEEPWMAYFLIEVTDDIAMDSDPRNLWERDQIEFFMDGDDLEGSEDVASFEWWQSPEIYGKFGVSRETTFEGNPGVMSEFQEDIFADEFGQFVAAAAVAAETGNNGDYFVEYAVSLEPMFWHGTFEGTETETAEQIVADSTVVKWTVSVSDDDNFDNGDTERSHAITYFRDPVDADWRNTAAFANLTFTGPYSPDAGPRLEAGDANMDLNFNQLDLVQVQIAAKYLTGQPATWGEGDWNGAPGGAVGNPPQGDGTFNQLDIIAALNAGKYLTGPYGALAGPAPPDGENDEQASIVYNADTGEVGVNAPASTNLTSINIDSEAGIFVGHENAQHLDGSFDNSADNNIFKATFGSSFGSLNFGAIAQTGLSQAFVIADLTAVGSLAGGGDLGPVDLIYIPEPSAILLLALGLLGLATLTRPGR